MDNLYVYSPLVLPFPYLRIARWINRRIILSILNRWAKVMGFNDPVIWVFLPTPLSLDIIDNFDNSVVVYYCIDNFRVSSAAAGKICRYEERLLKRADLVFVTSRALFEYCSRFSRSVSVSPFAVNFEEFQKRKAVNACPGDLQGFKRPLIGYIGGVHKWIDFELVKFAAAHFNGHSFIFVGPVQTDVSTLSGAGNIHFLGSRKHEFIADYINNFDVCIIPYLLTEYTRNVYPTKLNEYLAMGKPVVSTDLDEIRHYNSLNDNVVLIGKSPEDFCRRISESLGPDAIGASNKRIAIAKNNSWSFRIQQMSKLLIDEVKKKESRIFDWREKFNKICKTSRKRFLAIAALALFVYLSIFYTPLVWMLAGPLKIAQAPARTDVIVVLAGGVGESGQAGQGYEERVGYAVDLYKKGYAPELIFSSGFMYFFKEPLVMKALATSLGVPQDAVTLEDKSKSTYEQVLCIRDILKEKKLSRIILVSAPYHMLRLSLTMEKNAPDIKAVYAPVPDSVFYRRALDNPGNNTLKQIEPRQIKAILHEYAAIVYYWLKRRI